MIFMKYAHVRAAIKTFLLFIITWFPFISKWDAMPRLITAFTVTQKIYYIGMFLLIKFQMHFNYEWF